MLDNRVGLDTINNDLQAVILVKLITDIEKKTPPTLG